MFSKPCKAHFSPAQAAGVAKSARYWFFIHYLTGQLDSLPKPAAAQNPDETSQLSRMRWVEAALFLAREGISSRKLAKLAGLADATEARTLIRRLNQHYEDNGRAYRVEEIAGGFAILTRAEFSAWLRRMGSIPAQRRLSQSAMETLAIVAYRQPVQRVQIEAIRGVGCSEVLKQLMDLELVRIAGRSEELGRPYLYGTTRRFLQMFGLRSVDRLPRMSWVNEPNTSVSVELASTQSETEDSAMTHSSTVADKTENMQRSNLATILLLEEQTAHRIPSNHSSLPISMAGEEEDEEFFDEDEDFDDEDFDDEDDGEWDDEEEEEDEEEDESEEAEVDDLEEEGEWEEVDDEDEGWVDEEEEEEEEEGDDEEDDEDDELWDDEEVDDEEDWD